MLAAAAPSVLRPHLAELLEWCRGFSGEATPELRALMLRDASRSLLGAAQTMRELHETLAEGAMVDSAQDDAMAVVCLETLAAMVKLVTFESGWIDAFATTHPELTRGLREAGGQLHEACRPLVQLLYAMRHAYRTAQQNPALVEQKRQELLRLLDEHRPAPMSQEAIEAEVEAYHQESSR